MEHSSLSGVYTDTSVTAGFPLPSDTLRVRHLPACPLSADGSITPKPVSDSPTSILVVPPVDVQGVRLFRNSNISMAITALQNTLDSSYNAGINFYWALRYVPAGQGVNAPSLPGSYSGSSASAIGMFSNAQFTLASGMYMANDRAISIALPNPVSLQSGDSIALQVWYTSAFPRVEGFDGNLSIGLNAVFNYMISYK